MKPTSPCKGCEPPKRTMYCHAHCKEYMRYQKENDEANKKEDAENDARYTSHPNKERAFRRKMRWK